MEQMQYKAFISYRHTSPDQDIAKKLHTQIETYGIPASLKKSLGISKMGRVFRDQEELPLSSNLGDDIHQALDNSEWLICICSPRYLESKWCLEELRYFLSLGRRDRVLTILAEGEPADSFPEELRFREENGVKVEAEPLAADVRAESLEGSLKKLNNEKLRILAPMLGVNYDDLKQRARQRRNRILDIDLFALTYARRFIGIHEDLKLLPVALEPCHYCLLKRYQFYTSLFLIGLGFLCRRFVFLLGFLRGLRLGGFFGFLLFFLYGCLEFVNVDLDLFLGHLLERRGLKVDDANLDGVDVEFAFGCGMKGFESHGDCVRDNHPVFVVFLKDFHYGRSSGSDGGCLVFEESARRVGLE